MHPFLPFILSVSSAGNPPKLESVKLAKVVKDEDAYTSFGVFVKINNDKYIHYCRRGANHLLNGFGHALPYTVSTDTWDSVWPVVDGDVMPDHRDCWGGNLDNGDIIIFNQFTWNNLMGGDWSSLDIYYRRAHISDPLNFGPRISIWDVEPGLERLYRGLIYGKPEPMDAPGEYCIMFHQWNEAAATSSSTVPHRWLSYYLHTSDYFNTIDEFYVVNDSTLPIGEGTVTYLGDDKLIFIARPDGVSLYCFESSDRGVTWVDRGRIRNFRHYGVWDMIITQPVWHKGLLYIMYQNRDTEFIEISRANDPDVFFGQTAAWSEYEFNDPECCYYNGTTSDGIAIGLGYGDMMVIDEEEDIFLMAWSKEIRSDKCVLMWTRSKLDEDPNPPQPIPVIEANPAYVTSTQIRFDVPMGNGVTGYTEEALQEVRWFICDFATDAAFTSFPVVHWRLVDPDTAIQDLRIHAKWMLFQGLTPNTTYYFRMKACNLAGETIYTVKQVTTLP